MLSIKENLSHIQTQIAHSKVKIIAVTKYYGIEGIIEAYKAGLRDFGENKVQDAILKIDSLPENIKKNSKFHLIGHLQTNKAKKAVEYFDLIHSVDSIKLAEKIDYHSKQIGKIQNILLQVNFSQEVTKNGFLIDELREVYCDIIKLKSIKVLGLMTMAPINGEKDYLNQLYRGVKNLKNELNLKYNYNELLELSMGMSNDYKEAVKAGSTMIRIGRKLFKEVN